MPGRWNKTGNRRATTFDALLMFILVRAENLEVYKWCCDFHRNVIPFFSGERPGIYGIGNYCVSQSQIFASKAICESISFTFYAGYSADIAQPLFNCVHAH